MSKLTEENKFFDLSDYGRPVAKIIAKSLKNTNTTAIHVTLWFVIAGLISFYFILKEWYIVATLFLILKSILDAADGELAREKESPSYTGRFLDSVSDIILNFLLILLIGLLHSNSWYWIIGAFCAIQLQGTLYNYYYVILRNNTGGDTTSRIIETYTPTAFPQEKQSHVTLLFNIYKICYGAFDQIIYFLDRNASTSKKSFPNWFMTILSLYGLGFQLLLIGVLLVAGIGSNILPFIVYYSIGIPILILVRKLFLS